MLPVDILACPLRYCNRFLHLSFLPKNSDSISCKISQYPGGLTQMLVNLKSPHIDIPKMPETAVEIIRV